MSKAAFGISDYKRISAIAHSTIIAVFNSSNFVFNSDDVEEVVAQTLANVIATWDRYDESRSCSNWFSVIARNCANTYMTDRTVWYNRHAPITVSADHDTFCESEPLVTKYSTDYQSDVDLISNERISILYREIERLGDKAGRAILMQSQGYSLREIQESMGMEYGALRTMMSRGRSKLAESSKVQAMYTEIFGHSLSKSA